jgi:GT2 family glycosyltransferase
MLPEGTRRGALGRAAKAGAKAFSQTFAAQMRLFQAQAQGTPFRPGLFLRIQRRVLRIPGFSKVLGIDRSFQPFRVRGAARTSVFSGSVEVLIPVYNRIDQLRMLVSDIQREQSAGNVPPNVEFHLLDDASGHQSAKALDVLKTEMGARLTRRVANLGFLGNVNAAYEISTADVVLLLNSDVRLPPRFFQRLLQWVGEAPSAALVTVLSFSEIAHRRSGLVGATWWEVDDQLAARADGMFMQACTAVGYCLLIDRRLVSSPLLDDAFGHGYGEDSDLHYRVISESFNSLVYLGMCISHEGGASYSLRLEAKADFATGQSLFWSRWGGRYAREFPAFHRAYSRFLRHKVGPKSQRLQAPRVTFAVPATDERVGGQQVSVRAAKSLASAGIATRVLSLNGNTGIVLDAFRSIEPEDYESLEMTKADALILCGNDAIEWWSNRTDDEHRPKLAYVLQGFDHLMDPRFVQAIEGAIRGSDVVFSVSPFLDKLAAELGATNVRAFTPELGAAAFAANPTSWSNRSLDVLISLRVDHTKGWWIGAALANVLAERAVQVGVFGPDELVTPYVDARVIRMNRLARSELLALFGDTRVFVDPVFAEGYGMMPREAILRGAHAFIGAGGGNEPGRLRDHATVFDRHYDVYGLARRIIERVAAGTPCGSAAPECPVCGLEPDLEVDRSRPTLEHAVLSWMAGANALRGTE